MFEGRKGSRRVGGFVGSAEMVNSYGFMKDDKGKLVMKEEAYLGWEVEKTCEAPNLSHTRRSPCPGPCVRQISLFKLSGNRVENLGNPSRNLPPLSDIGAPVNEFRKTSSK